MQPPCQSFGLVGKLCCGLSGHWDVVSHLSGATVEASRTASEFGKADALSTALMLEVFIPRWYATIFCGQQELKVSSRQSRHFQAVTPQRVLLNNSGSKCVLLEQILETS